MRSGNDTRNRKRNGRPSIINRDHTREDLANLVTGHHPETHTRTAEGMVVVTVVVMVVVMAMVMVMRTMAISAGDVTIILRYLSLVPLRVVLY